MKIDAAEYDKMITVTTAFIGEEKFAKVFVDCMFMLRAKNADYTEGRAKQDRIANFRTLSNELGLSMESIWYVYIYKHLSAVKKFIKNGQTESEPIRGRIMDIINYMVLFESIITDSEKDVVSP